MQEQRADARPELASHVENMHDYDVIFLDYPIWWGTLPQPVFTFLDEYVFQERQ
jgi:putative NADPH-quinone reductase